MIVFTAAKANISVDFLGVPTGSSISFGRLRGRTGEPRCFCPCGHVFLVVVLIVAEVVASVVAQMRMPSKPGAKLRVAFCFELHQIG